jgi:chaperone modulatory protein CbpM
MRKEILIPADEFCACHNIEISFITSLNEAGLIEISSIEDSYYIRESQLLALEKIVRLYCELDINLEGIDTITHLLERIISMQDELIYLRNKLRLYEENEL